MPLHNYNYNYNLNDTMSLRDKLMMSTSLSYSRLIERKTLQEVMTIANPVLLGMLLIACGGGGGSTPAKSTPTEEPMNGGNEPATPILEITTPDGSKVKSDGAGILSEETSGADEAVLLGDITDDKNDGTAAITYALAEAADDNKNGDFNIVENKLYYIGAYSGDFETASDAQKIFTLKIIRTEGDNTQTLTFIVNLKDEEELAGIFLHPAGDANVRVFTDGEKTIENEDGTQTRSSGAGLLNEGANTRTELGTFDDDENDGSGTVIYALAEVADDNNNGDFEITDGTLFYTGTNAGDFENGDTLTISIIRKANENDPNPETFTYIIRLLNIDDIAPTFAAASLPAGSAFALAQDTTDATISVISGVGENLASSDNIVLFIARASDGDNIAGATATDTITYSLAANIADNNLFAIDTNTGAVTLKAGAVLNYESKQRYQVQVTATSSSTLGDGSTTPSTQITTQLFYVDVTNENDAPTGAFFTSSANFGTGPDIGSVRAIDPDSTSGWTFALVAGAGDTDNGLFTLATNGALQFADTDSATTGIQFTKKAAGETYQIRVRVTDSDGASFTQAITIAESTAQVGGQYSGYADAAGDGLLPENTNIAFLGKVTFAGSNPDAIALADDTASNNNGDFLLVSTPAATIPANGVSTLTVGAGDGGKFVVASLDGSNVVTAISFKTSAELAASLAAGDLVIGRLSNDELKIGTIGDEVGGSLVSLLTLDTNANTITLFSASAAISFDARPNELLYIGADSGDFEADTPPTLNVEIAATTVVSQPVYTPETGTTPSFVLTGAGGIPSATTANHDVYYVVQNGGATFLNTRPDGGNPLSSWDTYYLVGKVNNDATDVDAAGGVVTDSAWTIVSNVAYLALNTRVSDGETETTTETYIVRLADVDESTSSSTAAENVPTTKYPASKTLEEILKEIEAEHQTTPQENQPQWQPNPYTDDSDLIDLPDTGPDIL